MYLLYKCKAFSFKYTSGKINSWKSTGINNYTKNSNMDAVSVATTSLPPLIDNGRMSVRLEGAYFKQMRLLRPNNDNIVILFEERKAFTIHLPFSPSNESFVKRLISK